MCPICLSTAALIIAGKSSAGGLAALAVKKLHPKSRRKIQQLRNQSIEREENKMNHPKVVSEAEWLAARKQLLAKEKDLTRRRDALSQERRNLPMVKVDKDYVFEGPNGQAKLRDLFGRHDQLIIYHFMFDPDWEQGCKSCSHFMDNAEGAVIHLAARNTYQRGLDVELNTYNFLDLTALGRQEGEDRTQSWIRHHDSYPS